MFPYLIIFLRSSIFLLYTLVMPHRRGHTRTTIPSRSAHSTGGPALENEALEHLVETLNMYAHSRPSIEQVRRLGMT